MTKKQLKISNMFSRIKKNFKNPEQFLVSHIVTSCTIIYMFLSVKSNAAKIKSLSFSKAPKIQFIPMAISQFYEMIKGELYKYR